VLLSEIWGLISVRHPLWREHGPAICSVITQWSQSRRARIYIPQEQGGPVIPTGTGFFTLIGNNLNV
jgi:hypothetical protein